MKEGDLLLLDEISLADDSVLERLNSVLEPSRSMTVTEMGGDDFSHLHVVASPGFNILATMNPGGDYGKKELSPALRNRFTEIWVPSMSDTEDFLEVMQARSSNEDISAYSTAILSFFRWFETEYAFSQKAFGLRDALAWIDFMKATKSSLGLPLSFVHGCLLICVDALPASVSDEATLSCIRKASSMVDSSNIEIEATPSVVSSSDYFQVGPFRVVKGRDDTLVSQFSFVAPTARSNTLKLLRALQISKPVLLEGDPGVGKTSLVLALAAACGYEAIRINLSDQTDLSDLFGSDLPTEGGGFSWKDAPFLTAMKNGNWVLLDEMNLAPQTVLEGLNSCLDHRGEVYIPELDRNFRKHPQFRIFATQNPLVQGGGRKGLPKSYLNRFTSITLQALTEHDTVAIAHTVCPRIDISVLQKMALVNAQLDIETRVRRSFGQFGAPWEFNLRDTLRWLQLLQSVEEDSSTVFDAAKKELQTLYVHRFRTRQDRAAASELFEKLLGMEDIGTTTTLFISETFLELDAGHLMPRRELPMSHSPSAFPILISEYHGEYRSLATAIDRGWLIILQSLCEEIRLGVVRTLASLKGSRLREFDMSSSQDTMELLGTFEQDTKQIRFRQAIEMLSCTVSEAVHSGVGGEHIMDVIPQLHYLLFKAEGTKLDRECALNTLHATEKCLQDQSTYTSKLAAIRQKLLSLDIKKGSFVWRDGSLVRSMLSGEWLLLRNANFCSQAVLDRLNSVFEINGRLQVNERGPVEGEVITINPHPDFRMFLSLDPSKGELSRAMRNRGIETFLVTSETPLGFGNDTGYRNLLYEPSLTWLTRLFSPLAPSPSVMWHCASLQNKLAKIPPSYHGIAARFDCHLSSDRSLGQLLSRAVDCGLYANVMRTAETLSQRRHFVTYRPLDKAALPFHFLQISDAHLETVVSAHSAAIYNLASCRHSADSSSFDGKNTSGGDYVQMVTIAQMDLQALLIELCGFNFETLQTDVTDLIFFLGAYNRHLIALAARHTFDHAAVAETLEWLTKLVQTFPSALKPWSDPVVAKVRRAITLVNRLSGKGFELFWRGFSISDKRLYGLNKNVIVSRIHTTKLEDMSNIISEISTILSSECRQERSVGIFEALNSATSCINSDYNHSSLYEEVVGIETQMQTILDILERASTSANEEYRTVFCSTLMPQAYALLAAVEQGEYETELGKSMVALARSFWRLLIPNFPVDPVAVILHRGSFLADEIAGIDTSTHVDAESNVVFPAQSTPRIALLERWNDLLKVEAASLPVPPVSRLPQPALLFALFQDLHGFSKHVLHVDLSNALSPPALNDNSSEISRNLYASVQLFTQKLSQIYGYFDDILRPIFFCLSILQLGLSIVGNAPSRSTAQVQELVENILTFPTVAISIEDVDLPSLSGFPLMEWNLFRLGLCLRRQCNLPIVLDRSTILSAYTILHSEWLRLQDIQENEKQSKDSLYKMKTYDYLDSENDVDGQEFHDLFPAYDESDIDEPILPTPRKSIWWSEIWTIHSALFLGHQSQKAMRILEASRDAILQTVIQNSAVTFADSLDNLSLPYQTTRLHQWRRAMDGLNDETPDFYSEGNIRETSRAIACLRPLRQRLSSLLAEFPEQVVLEHLRDRCDDILRLYIDTPIMRILTKLEQLLLDLEDWEKYADKAHSLEYFRSDLIQLVLSWRRLELQSWSALLSKEEKNFNADLSDWFFRFYTIMSPAMESDVEPTKRLRETISLLRSFIADSNIGQYEGRLRFLLSFSAMMTQFRSVPEFRVSPALSDAVSNVETYYKQFSPSIETEVSAVTQSCQAEISNVILLASWKDTNVYAVRDSAKKSHSQLYRQVRKYRRGLQAPSNQLFSFTPEEEAQTPFSVTMRPPSSEMSLDLDEDTSERYSRHRNLRNTWHQLQNILNDKLSHTLTSNWADDVDTLSSMVITTTQELRDHPLPVTANGGNRTIAKKNLLRLKRKAWSDLLKSLRLSGLPLRPTAETQSNVRDDYYLFTLPPLNTSAFDGDARPYLRYLFRILHLLPEVHASIAATHSDILKSDLERAIGYIDSCVSIMYRGHGALCNLVSKFSIIEEAVLRLQEMAKNNEGWTHSDSKIERHVVIFSHIQDALQELNHLVEITCDSLPDQTITQQFRQLIRPTIDDIKEHLKSLKARSCSSSLPRITWVPGEVKLLQSSVSIHLCTVQRLRLATSEFPLLAYAIRPTLQWLLSFEEELKTVVTVEESEKWEHDESLRQISNDLVDNVLVVMQDLSRIIDEDVSIKTETDSFPPKGFLSRPDRLVHRISSSFRAVEFSTHLVEFIDQISKLRTPHCAKRCVSRCLPFSGAYLEALRLTVHQSLHWQKAIAKLTYVLSNTVLSLSKEGFCQPPDAGAGEEDASSGELESGTGLGEGHGQKNISDQIPGEEELEGLKEEMPENKKEEDFDTSQKDAVEMSEEFEGEEREYNNEEEDQQDKGSEDDIEEKMSSVDPLDSTAVDEKFWEGQREDERSQPGSQVDRSQEQNKLQEEPMDTEDQGQGDGDEESKDPTKNPTEREDIGAEKDSENTSELQDEESSEPPQDDIHEPQNGLDQVAMTEQEVLQLPEDLNIDLPTDNTEAEADEVDSVLAEENEGNLPDEEDPASPEGMKDVDGGEDDKVDDPSEETSGQKDGFESTLASSGGGQGQQDSELLERNNDENATNDLNQNPSSSQHQSGTSPDDADTTQPGATQPSWNDSAQTPTNNLDIQGHQSQESHRPSVSQNRTVDQSLSALRKRLQDILEQSESENSGGLERAEVTYDPNESTDPDSVLAAATQAEVEEFRNRADNAGDTMGTPQDHEEDVKMEEAGISDEQGGIQERNDVTMDICEDFDHNDTTEEKAIPFAEFKPSSGMFDQTNINSPKLSQDEPQPKLMTHATWREANAEQPLDPAAVWKHYMTSTSSLSFQLAEQLRLILEPTMSTRLRGDYRTGKRLNMKKVISFVASDFKKDKIWMRRTRPSQREYNILLAIDDSKSMREDKTIDLTLKAMALLLQGLERLEVGQIGLASFGGVVKMVRPLAATVAMDGASIIDAFTFDQEKTDVALLLEKSMAEFSSAAERASSTAAELWQLEIIISDGHCNDHDKLRHLLRQAKEQRILVVFIIVDSLHRNSAGESESILSLNSLSYVSKSDGSGMEVKLDRYMDSFPFEYYVVLRDVAVLPQILSGILRQFFENVAINE
ncbi:hypothetical protein BT69DRAFT_1357891 [Atractiella rhizophila]|nr:hypothetical protein BT69DRAFT_1357891 [Atractiella rhizophila]